MLVIRSHDARCHHLAVRHGVPDFDWTRRQNACGTNFVVDCSCLGELEREDVFVVPDCDDSLEDKNSRSSYNGVASAVVGVFPEDSVVNFVAADYVRDFDGITCSCVQVGVEVFDVAKTITACRYQREVE